jgi:hypothetical protein
MVKETNNKGGKKTTKTKPAAKAKKAGAAKSGSKTPAAKKAAAPKEAGSVKTVAMLKEELTLKKIPFNAKAKKAELEALLAGAKEKETAAPKPVRNNRGE